jgi:hypothetical protein
MHDADTIAREYLAVWNQADPAQRQAQLDAAWAADAEYADPLMAAQGREAICAMIEQARGQFPGHAFRLRGQPDTHRQFVRFSWSLNGAGGAPVAGGTDVVRLDGHGRVAGVVGFLDGL